MHFPSRIRRRALLLAWLVQAALAPAHAGELSLALADSTCEAMKEVGDLYAAKAPVELAYLCKSSGLLAKGLRGGVLKADIFVSADREWMDYAIENGLVDPNQVVSPWGNALVVATAKATPLRLAKWEDLASDKITTILIGDPGTAPFGRYAKQALESSGLWDRVKHKIETRKNISLVAESLAAGNGGTVGILFRTHLGEPLRELHRVNPAWHPPIRYYLAPLGTAAGNPETARFLKFLRGGQARSAFEARGFDLSDR